MKNEANPLLWTIVPLLVICFTIAMILVISETIHGQNLCNKYELGKLQDYFQGNYKCEKGIIKDCIHTEKEEDELGKPKIKEVPLQCRICMNNYCTLHRIESKK